MAVARGTLVSVERMADNSFTVTLQHDAFVAIYRHVERALKTQGTAVEQGEAIGIANGEKEVEIELWENGQFVNPEEVIVW